VNCQSDKFPTLIYKEPLHDVSVGVWCAMSATRFIGPDFLRP
jgi:hypothetical protein